MGGRGLRRSLKKEARLSSYFRGEWKPRWLKDYIAQKAERDQAAATRMVEDAPEPGNPTEGEEATAESNPWADLGWWTPDEWQQWWNWNGFEGNHADNTTSASSWSPGRSTTTSTSTSSSSFGFFLVGRSDSGLVSSTSTSLSPWWEDFQWMGWLSTTSTTSSSSHPPNHGLFPTVGPAQPMTDLRMELTNAEVASLQEAAVPQQTLHRLQAMMQMLDQHQLEGRGPEARWALGCLLRRLDESVQARDVILGVLQRRLVPRGYLPVRRYPVSEDLRWRIYSWARNYRDDLVHVADRHLQTGLVPADQHFPSAGMPLQHAPSSPSVVASEAAASTPREEVSITDEASVERRSSGSSSEEPVSPPSLDSSWACDENGVPGDAPRGPPCPTPVNAPGETPVSSAEVAVGNTSVERALRGELLGIWREPVDENVSAEVPEGEASSSSSTTSTTTSSWLVPVPPHEEDDSEQDIHNQMFYLP